MNETDRNSNTSTIQCRLSNDQKTLLQNLMNQHTDEDALPSQYSKQAIWSEVAVKLNKVPGSRKTWMQWRKTWEDIQKNSKKFHAEKLSDYTRAIADRMSSISEDAVGNDNVNIDNVARDSDGDDGDDDVKRKRAKNMSQTQRKLLYNLVNSNEHLRKDKSDAASLSCLKKRKEWKKIAMKLNSVPGPQKNWLQWKKCWHDIQKYYVRRGAVDQILNSETDSVDGGLLAAVKRKRNCNELTTCEYMEKEQIPVGTSQKNLQLQLLQRTADEECNIVGSLVAIKLRSMQREQKLIAEKLISEILFQGQMEMFQYSDRAVHIPGYMP